MRYHSEQTANFVRDWLGLCLYLIFDVGLELLVNWGESSRIRLGAIFAREIESLLFGILIVFYKRVIQLHVILFDNFAWRRTGFGRSLRSFSDFSRGRRYHLLR